jgi:hypothetical protein
MANMSKLENTAIDAAARKAVTPVKWTEGMSPLVQSPASRYETIMDWYAPIDEDGVRHPGDGFITREQALELLQDKPEDTCGPADG